MGTHDEAAWLSDLDAQRERVREEDEAREEGFYFVKLPWGKWTIARWGRDCGKLGWALPGHPHEHETIYFSEIGDKVVLPV